ncbi:MAG: endolytic transglycosylase MltG [Gemmatimonadetes bacterium]|nr:endolytic transglycosylase MltG [Gemmatimonadota bacterium]MDE3256792.1 endolytic transglycosylase MltG [Gemmatimonadota bacterium]
MRNQDEHSLASNDSGVRPSRRPVGVRSVVVRSIIALFGAGIAGLLLVVLALNRPTGSGAKDIVIQKGMTVLQIGELLHREGVIRSPRLLVMFSVFDGTSRRLKAGMHRFPENLSTWEALKKLAFSRDEFRRVTLPEGMTLARTLAVLASELDLDHNKMRRLAYDPGYCRRLGVPADNLEGYLFPETYQIPLTRDEEQVIRMLVRHFFTVFDSTMAERAHQTGLSAHEVVTLASIIEGEALLDRERATISAVYHNRLEEGMFLQADPTVQYVIEDGPRRLFYRDYKIDSPYNTYRHRGLPPGPVMNPGAASLRAALYPEDVDYLYFVAKGDGSHVFSRTVREHEEAKRRTRSARRRSWRR